jgi:hypothetical protein
MTIGIESAPWISAQTGQWAVERYESSPETPGRSQAITAVDTVRCSVSRQPGALPCGPRHTNSEGAAW